MEINLSIGGIALIPIIVAIVEGLKEIGLPTNYARLTTGGLSVAFYALMLFIEARPEYSGYVITGTSMVALFLSSTGLYAIGKNTASALRGE